MLRNLASSLLAIVLVNCCTTSSSAQPRYTEPLRPQFHFTPERNWMNDPNGMLFYEGEWHLCYQYNPHGNSWGHMSWGHAVSRDLVHWQHLPLALAEEGGIMNFSGCAVVDWKNSSGLGTNGKPPLVAIFTGHREGRQDQRIAYSNDRGRTWTKYADNPVLDVKMSDFRDPKVFWHEALSRWIMTVALSLEKKVHFYASPDLKAWKYAGEFGPAGATGGIWECPDLFPLVAEGGESKWVLIVNLNPGGPAGGSGCQYFVGDFDGQSFRPDPGSGSASNEPLWADYGADFYAGVSWSDVPQSDGRRLWIGWMSNWNYAKDIPTSPWRNAMSIPRELRLKKTDDGWRLRQVPIAELESLRRKELSLVGGTVAEVNDWIRSQDLKRRPLELSFTIGETQDKAGIKLFVGDQQATIIGIDRSAGEMYIDRTKSGQTEFNQKFSVVQKAPILKPSKPVSLRLFVDTSSVEVFANDGEQVLTSLVFPNSNCDQIEFFGSEKTKISSLKVWPLESAWKSAE